MINLFIECLRALKNYTGLKFLFGLTFLAWFYLFFREKDKSRRVIFVIMPVLVMIVFLCPLTFFLFTKARLDTDVYYRMLWMIPMGIITVYAMVKFAGEGLKKRIAVGIVSCVLIIAFGNCVYKSPIFFKSENVYGIPQQTIDIVDFIKEADGKSRISILPSADLVTTIRQYDANIMIPYGRDTFVNTYEIMNPVFVAFEQTPVLNYKNLVEASREYEVEYIVVHVAKPTEDNPLDAGLEYVGEVDDHLIYRDKLISDRVDEMEKYY